MLQGASREILERTQRLWQERTGQLVSVEDTREIIRNISVFFELVAEWANSTSESGDEACCSIDRKRRLTRTAAVSPSVQDGGEPKR